MWPTRRLVAFLIVLSIVSPVYGALFVPKAKLWDRWTAHDPGSTTTVDHSAWTHFLTTYVRPHIDGVNRVAYAEVIGIDKKALADYVAKLTAMPISTYNRAEQRAYWINLYNALTVKLVLDHYPVKSIRDIGPLWGPWGKKRIRVEGERLSLNDIEHRILRPIWRDPRIHYAVNCAAIGCPNLQKQAFTAINAERLLTRGARAYVNHERGASIEEGRLIVSSIYTWFHEDFGNTDAGVIRHLRDYAEPALASALTQTTKIAGDHYDWSLNDAVRH